MAAIFHRLYALRVRRSLDGSPHARFAAVSRHYHRFAAMYGAEHNFRIAK